MMEIDREKLLRALRCCAGVGRCGDCPYNSGGDDYSGCYRMHLEAYTLVSEMTRADTAARLLGVEQLLAVRIGGRIWVETRFMGSSVQLREAEVAGAAGPDEHADVWILLRDGGRCRLRDYGADWRAWDKMPTREQRRLAWLDGRQVPQG